MFSANFAFQNPDQSQVTPADTVWGAPLEATKADAKAPGQYV